ncbi:MAG: hypothetical protein GY810_15160 [Aureispira sp.]|nr:hypothetical protein [Aureispira sp.]
MQDDDDILDDMDGLNDPPFSSEPFPKEEKGHGDGSLASIGMFFLIFVGLIVFSKANRSRSNSAKIDLDRMNRLIKSTQSIDYQPINREKVEQIENAQKRLKRTLDSITKERNKHLFLEEYEAKKK